MSERCLFVPTYVLEQIAEHGGPHAAERARQAVRLDTRLRSTRPGPVRRAAAVPTRAPTVRRSISDAAGSTALPGRLVRSEGQAATGDVAVDEAYEGLGATWRLLHEEFGRDSLDDAGMTLLGVAHYGQEYANAFWDGEHMVFGDGDGEYFERFTASLDVIGHELAHGLTDSTARLEYQGQSGALNESVSDAVGAMVAQHVAGQDAQDADWLIGADLFTDKVQGVALRSMLEPGTAYDDPVLGRDPQPASMADYVQTTDDNGGVHINSGIPNRAFALAATAIGGSTWDGVGAVWMAVLTGGVVRPDCDFATFAGFTVDEAGRRFGPGSAQVDAVAEAWSTVGVQVAGSGNDPARGNEMLDHQGDGDTLSENANAGTTMLEDATQPAAPTPPRVVVVGRSGGVTGMSTERRMNLGTLPQDQASRWKDLISSGVLQSLELARPRPDGFVYRVRCPADKLDVTAAETELPDDVRSMIDDALRRD